MKKFLAISMLVLSAFSLVACGADNAATEEETEVTTTADTNAEADATENISEALTETAE